MRGDKKKRRPHLVQQESKPARKLEPVVLPNVNCTKCGREHPDRLMLNSPEAAGYLRHEVSSIYSMKSRGELPPCVPGRRNPFWYTCDLAYYLFPRPVGVLRSLLAARTNERGISAEEGGQRINYEVETLHFELRRSISLAAAGSSRDPSSTGKRP